MLPTGTTERNAYILDSIAAHSDNVAYNWVEVQVPTDDGTDLRISVFEDAMMVDGVRVGLSARTSQQVADMVGGILCTPKMADIIFAARQRTAVPHPQGTSAMTATSTMETNSKAISADLAKSGGTGLASTVGKFWCLSNRNTADLCINYGWHVMATGSWGGIKVTPCVSLLPGISVIQNAALAHNYDHLDYCVAPDTRVLTSDLRWVPAGDIVEGQEIIGFDENVEKSYDCKYRAASVVRSERKMLECIEIKTTVGTVVASLDHRWVAREKRVSRSESSKTWQARKKAGLPRLNTHWGWVRSEDLRVGQEIAVCVRPWEVDESREGGWMAGILDGEGWCSPPTGVGVGQKRGIVLDAIVAKFEADGFVTAESEGAAGVVRVMAKGPRASLRVLGRYRPIRLLPKARKLWEGTKVFCGGRGRDHATVLEVRKLGVREVVAMQTTTGTLVCEGMLSHNSQTLVLAHQDAMLNGRSVKLAALLQDPSYGRFLSHEGPLTRTRLPVGEAAFTGDFARGGVSLGAGGKFMTFAAAVAFGWWAADRWSF